MCHDDVIKWKHFPRYWPFVRGIHRSPVNSPHKGQWRGALMFSFDLHLNKRLSKQWWGWWFETPSRSLWRHCNGFSAIFVLMCCPLSWTRFWFHIRFVETHLWIWQVQFIDAWHQIWKLCEIYFWMKKNPFMCGFICLQYMYTPVQK